MLFIMRMDARQEDITRVIDLIESSGLHAHPFQGKERVVIAATGENPALDPEQLINLPGLDRISQMTRPYKLASREFHPENTVFPLDGMEIGGDEIIIIAGPSSVESRSQMMEIAFAVKEAGAHLLRGGAYKLQASPYVFQGLGLAGLEILAEVRQATGLSVVTEVVSPDLVPLVASYVDVLQIGARNMQNYDLLRAVGQSTQPVLLKRGVSATVDELLMSAEYILSNGNRNVILCERGIRTFETSTRNTTDINAIPVVKSLSHLPLILDPSHSTGNWQYVAAIARAGIAAGADGLIIEVHCSPDDALSDGAQSLKPEKFANLVGQVKTIAQAIGRKVRSTQRAEKIY